MRKTIWVRLIPAVLASTMILAGCANGAGQNPSANVTAAAKEKPPLKVPASFANTAEKRTFAMKAVDDGYYKEAAPLLEAVVKETPNDATAYSNLGTARFNIKDYAGAAQAWSKAAELNPAMAAEMKNNVGNALRENKQYAEAEASYREALKLDKTRWNAAINLADVLKTNGKLADAVKVLDQAAQDNKQIKELATLLTSYKAEQQKANANKG